MDEQGSTGLAMRLPRWPRAWVGGFTSIWCGSLLWLTITDWPGTRGALLRGFGVALAVLAAHRTLRTSFEVTGDTLVVRNLLRTRRIDRNEIARIWLGEPVQSELPGGFLPGPRGEAINVKTDKRTTTLEVTMDWLVTRRGHEARTSATERLQSWASQARPAPPARPRTER